MHKTFNWKKNLDDSTVANFQREVGTVYFDEVTQVVQAGKSSVTVLTGSTEDEQFF